MLPKPGIETIVVPTPTPEPSTVTKIWQFLTDVPDKSKFWGNTTELGWDLCLTVILLGFIAKMAGIREGNKLFGIGFIGTVIVFVIRVSYGL